jgi:UDP-N-acetylmuramoyl-tripeptide--D-alanyl-D-alanine ligase
MSAKWGAITAAEVSASVEGEILRGEGTRRFQGFSSDSRNIARDCLFWALQGERYDGHDFVLHALRKGAAGAVIRRGRESFVAGEKDAVILVVDDTLKALGDFAAWWRHAHRARVAAVTGSAGKTTTKEMAAAVLALKGDTLKNQGNFNNLIGLPLTLLLLEDAHRFAVLEMGMNRPGEIGRLTEIADPEVGVITNVAKAHLEGVGSLEGVARAKVELLEKMSPGAVAVLNGDDPVLMKAASSFANRRLCFGLGPQNDVRAENIRTAGLGGTCFDLLHGGKRFTAILKVPGFQNVHNALAAAAVSLSLGASPEEVLGGLAGFKGMKGRFVMTELPEGVILVDDTYNCNPLSLQFAVASLKALAHGEKIIVGLGEMFELGDETVKAHLEAGAMVADLGAKFFVALGDHAALMIRGSVDKGFPETRAVAAGDHREMEERIRAEMRPGDFVFLKGSRKAGLDKVAERLMGGEKAGKQYAVSSKE